MSYIRTTGPARRGGAERPSPESLAQAHARFSAFHACAPSALVTARCGRTIPKLLVQLGSLRGLIYSADRGDGGARTYIHFMENEPLLACDTGGTQLYIVGGRYRVTRRGIEG